MRPPTSRSHPTDPSTRVVASQLAVQIDGSSALVRGLLCVAEAAQEGASVRLVGLFYCWQRVLAVLDAYAREDLAHRGRHLRIQNGLVRLKSQPHPVRYLLG